MNATDLIKYIHEENKIKDVLESLECVYITETNNEFRCGLPDDTSKNRVRVKKNEYVNITIFQSDDEIIKGNIITLTMHIKNLSFFKANKYLHEILDLKFEYKTKKNDKKDITQSPLDIFKKVKKRKTYNVRDIEVYSEEILWEYIPGLHIEWYKEGILPFTAIAFKLGYSPDRKRIVIPHSKWDGEDNEYVGIMGRTTIKDHEMLDIPKYFPLKAFPKGLNIYGLKENYDTIIKTGYIVVHEAEKSTLKRHSRKDGTGGSIGSHDISDEQATILIGLNVEIIIAFDKGVSLHHTRRTCEKFYNVRKVSYMWDKYDILDGKEAPADKHNKLYNYLLKHRITYDKKEHMEFLNNDNKGDKS